MINVSIYTRESGIPEWIKYETQSVTDAKAKVAEHDAISAFATYDDSGGFAFNFSGGDYRMSQRGEKENRDQHETEPETKRKCVACGVMFPIPEGAGEHAHRYWTKCVICAWTT